MILDFRASSTPLRVLSLFPCVRLHSLVFVDGQHLSQVTNNQFYFGHAKYISISCNDLVETFARRSNTLSVIATLTLDANFLTSNFRYKNWHINITKARFLLIISCVLRLCHDTLIF